MQIVKRVWFVLVVVATLAGSVSTLAREYNVAEGQLIRLDASARKIVIRTLHGSQLQCTYNGETRVVGAGNSVTQLRPMSQVTVHYAKEEMEYVATEIEIHEHPF